MTIPFLRIAEQTNPLQLTLYAVCHHHEYGDTMYAVMSEHPPTEEEIIADVLESPFEPDKDEWIAIGVVDRIRVLTKR